MIEIPKRFGNSIILFHLIDKFQPCSLNHLKRNEINKFQLIIIRMQDMDVKNNIL